MKAQDLMTRKVCTCAPADSLERAARLMWENDVGCLVVTDGGQKPIGRNQSMNVENSADAVPSDFVEHLVRHLGVDGPAVLTILGDWLVHYEPLPRAMGQRAPGATVLKVSAAEPLQATLPHQEIGSNSKPYQEGR